MMIRILHAPNIDQPKLKMGETYHVQSVGKYWYFINVQGQTVPIHKAEAVEVKPECCGNGRVRLAVGTKQEAVPVS